MEIFEKIEKALQSEQADKILDFGGFHIQDKVKTHSQQGMVLIAKNKIRKTFAIKFYRPTDKDPKILKEGVENFIREVTILASLNHKNIVNVYTGGKAKWVEKENLWIINEGFDKKHFGNTDEALFYIMDFIKGNDISSVFPDPLKQNSKNPKFKQIPIYEQLKLFEDMISQLSKAINYYHSKKITHKDIKSDNIRFSTEDSTFIIVDFGFARHFTSPQDLSTITRTENLDIESIKAKNYELNDMGQFSEMLLRILPSFEGEYGINRYQEIKSAIEKGKDPKLDHRYKNMQEFYNSVRQYFLTESGWKFELKLDAFLAPNRFGKFDSKLRIPVSGSVLLSKEIRAIIDTPQFQRLRGVRQLGPTIFVFPGANHTRFEHSLGAYFLALKYLEKLLSIPNFKSICEPIEDSIKLFTLSALLHDIGHYPYSHWIEEIEKFPNGMKLPTHEERAQEIICSGTIGEILHDEWRVDPKTLFRNYCEQAY